MNNYYNPNFTEMNKIDNISIKNHLNHSTSIRYTLIPETIMNDKKFNNLTYLLIIKNKYITVKN